MSLMHTAGGLIFPGSPLAESKAQLEQIAGGRISGLSMDHSNT